MAQSRLSVGQPAPAFSATTYEGERLRLADFRGQRVLLYFFRFAASALCRQHLAELVAQRARLESQGVTVMAVFESPADSVLAALEPQGAPFPVIADPHQRLYAKYVVTPSWSGWLRGAMNVRAQGQALISGYLPGRPEGELAMRPAAFLIDAEGVIEAAHYGRDITDHLSPEQLLAWVEPQLAGRNEAELVMGLS